MERTYRAPAEAVFDAWTSEEVLRRWFHAEREWETPEAAVDLRLGRRRPRRHARPAHGDEYGGGGRYTEIDRRGGSRSRGCGTGEDPATLIEIDFEEADGVTTVRFTHSGLWDEEAVRSHERGWGVCFSILAETLAADRA